MSVENSDNILWGEKKLLFKTKVIIREEKDEDIKIEKIEEGNIRI